MMRITVARLVSFGLFLTACSVGAAEPLDSTTSTQPPTTSTSTTASTTSTTSTTLPPPGDPSLVNGLEVDDPTLLTRRILAVKVDNHPNARPQSGIDHADMVIELMVEGITRFITVWHESDVDFLGPMRSGRPTDPALLQAFNEPTFAISGAQAWVQGLIRGSGINMIKELSEGTFRVSGRRAPHNLYVDTSVLRQTADDRDYPDNPPLGPLWEFGPLPDDAESASEVAIDFSGNRVTWTWDPRTELWLRSASGRESMYRDEDGNEGRIAVPVLVALYVDLYTARPGSGQSGTPLPSSRTTGTGEAYVFADGKVIEGTWERDSETEWFRLSDGNGVVIEVPPGKSWVSLVPSHRGLSVES